MRNRRMTALLLIAALIGVATAASIGLTQRRIPSRGTIYIKVLGVEAYWDPECTSTVTEIEWGVLEPSDSVSKVIYIRNTGNAAVVLSMATENWSPTEAGTFITLMWDAESSTLDVNATLAVTLALSVSAEITGISDFQVDIVINGGG